MASTGSQGSEFKTETIQYVMETIQSVWSDESGKKLEHLDSYFKSKGVKSESDVETINKEELSRVIGPDAAKRILKKFEELNKKETLQEREQKTKNTSFQRVPEGAKYWRLAFHSGASFRDSPTDHQEKYTETDSLADYQDNYTEMNSPTDHQDKYTETDSLPDHQDNCTEMDSLPDSQDNYTQMDSPPDPQHSYTEMLGMLQQWQVEERRTNREFMTELIERSLMPTKAISEQLADQMRLQWEHLCTLNRRFTAIEQKLLDTANQTEEMNHRLETITRQLSAGSGSQSTFQ